MRRPWSVTPALPHTPGLWVLPASTLAVWREVSVASGGLSVARRLLHKQP